MNPVSLRQQHDRTASGHVGLHMCVARHPGGAERPSATAHSQPRWNPGPGVCTGSSGGHNRSPLFLVVGLVVVVHWWSMHNQHSWWCAGDYNCHYDQACTYGVYHSVKLVIHIYTLHSCSTYIAHREKHAKRGHRQRDWLHLCAQQWRRRGVPGRAVAEGGVRVRAGRCR
jgi:hypothetical protein